VVRKYFRNKGRIFENGFVSVIQFTVTHSMC
jgi:hypothetical protein